MTMKILLLALSFLTAVVTNAQESYQEPPKEILDLLDAPLTPSSFFDHKGEYIVMAERKAFKTLAELAEKEYRLGGLRINPATNGPSRGRYYHSLSIRNVKQKKTTKIEGLPEGGLIANLSWNAPRTYMAFTITFADGIELWMLDIEGARVKKLTGRVVNNAFGYSPFVWLPGGTELLVRFVDREGREFINPDQLPAGPAIQESSGQKAAARTYQDLLKNATDDNNFEYFTWSKLVKVSTGGTKIDFGVSGVIRSVSVSPDGEYVMIKKIRQPFSRLVPWYRFAYDVDLYGKKGKLRRSIAKIPLDEVRPKGFDATRKGPRDYSWRADKAHTIYWKEALDGGDPAAKVELRDALYMENISAEKQEPQLILKAKCRIRSIYWGDDELAIATDNWWKTRKRNWYLLEPVNGAHKHLREISTEDRYNNPGSFLMKVDMETGYYTLNQPTAEPLLYLEGEGYSPEGNRPFIDEWNYKTDKTKRLWRADGKTTYEGILKVLDPIKGDIITRIESKTQNPNYYFRNIFKRKKPVQITNFENPYASFAGVTKETIKYKRADGVDLQAVLYLPPGYDKEKDGRLPVFLWAYPREYKNAGQASQVKSSPHRFTRLYYGSAVYWAMRGYAILDNADFPIIGEGEDEPNDTFIEQLVANGKAAIEEVERLGVGDPERVAVGGHSYGAFMTANLLAHSDLFAAGIARSGAYNRTLTPFGFQSEERTLWDSTGLYMRMSPFMHADQVNEPILLIHGEADNNPGTFPMQSERFYNAIKGHGGHARLVVLPYESHGYSARENIGHMLWEMDQWLEKHVKNKEASEGKK